MDFQISYMVWWVNMINISTICAIKFFICKTQEKNLVP
jgi:hypothetical protein